MSDEKRSGSELEDDPHIGYGDIGAMASAETPFNQAVDLLATTGEEELELMCRTTREVAEAAAIGYSMIFRFNSRYVGGRIAQIERLTVSNGGKGRDEIVRSLQAGSGVSDGFYESQGGLNRSFSED